MLAYHPLTACDSSPFLLGTLANRAGTPVQRGLFKPRTKRVLWHHPNRVRAPSDIELGHAAWFQSFHRRAFAKHGRSLAQRQSLSRDRPLGDWAHDQLEKPSKQPLPQRKAAHVSADFQFWFVL